MTNRPDAVQAAAAIFAADWTSGVAPDPGPLVVSPTNARDQLLALVDGARVSLDLYAEVLRDPQMLDALAAAAERGVRVRIIISPSADFAAEVAALAASGVDIRLSSSLYIHAKLIVADGERAFVGSQNLSAIARSEPRAWHRRRRSGESVPPHPDLRDRFPCRKSAGDAMSDLSRGREPWREALPAIRDRLQEIGYDIASPQSGAPPDSIVARRDLGDRVIVLAIDAGGRFRAEITWVVGEWPSQEQIAGVPVQVVDAVSRAVTVTGELAGPEQVIEVVTSLGTIASAGVAESDASASDLMPHPGQNANTPLTTALCTYTVCVQSVPRSREPRVMTHRERQRRTMLRGFVRDRVGNRAVRGKLYA